MNELLAFIDAARAGEADKHDGPLTRLRKKHRSDYLKYYHSTPEQTQKDQERQRRYQEDTRKTAHRHGESWTDTDEAEAMSLDAPITATAKKIGRTYAAVRQGRERRVRYYDLSNSLVKTEHDEYMALMRRKDFTREDVVKHRKKWAAKTKAKGG